MDSLTQSRAIVQQLLTDYAELPTADPAIQQEIIFDEKRDRYFLLSIGWSGGRRIHQCVIHIDIIQHQIWIQANQTDQLIAEEMVKLGIPASSIVLAMQPPEVRRFTDYGVPHTEQITSQAS
jgi:hypothetical protein